MSKTKIEWADAVWNPVTGCSPISVGCDNCYAQRMSKRLAGRCGYPADEPFRVTRHPERLRQPLHWRKPRNVFVCSMGDLFHHDVEDWMLDEVFGVMLACRIFEDMPDHQFMVLTKRPGRMFRYLTERPAVEIIRAWAQAAPVRPDDEDLTFEDLVNSQCCHDWDENGRNSSGSEYRPWGYINRIWPLPNVWLGVTAENQETADGRIPLLLQTPAAKRFVSCEPLLGQVDLTRVVYERLTMIDALEGLHGFPIPHAEGPRLDWVIAGGETGPGARPMHPDWVCSLRDQCRAADTPFFFKSWGEWSQYEQMAVNGGWSRPPKVHHFSQKDRSSSFLEPDPDVVFRCGKQKAGRLLDGREWNEMPEVPYD